MLDLDSSLNVNRVKVPVHWVLISLTSSALTVSLCPQSVPEQCRPCTGLSSAWPRTWVSGSWPLWRPWGRPSSPWWEPSAGSRSPSSGCRCPRWPPSHVSACTTPRRCNLWRDPGRPRTWSAVAVGWRRYSYNNVDNQNMKAGTFQHLNTLQDDVIWRWSK